jgi:polysaccharide pyruvyl transferase CsaB
MKKIIICGNYGINNLGDEAICSGLIKLIESTFRNSKITVFSSDPVNTKINHQVNSVNYFPAGIRSLFKFIFLGKFIATFSALLKSDLFILGGGGLFNDEEKRSVYIWFIQVFWAILLHKKYVCIAQSVGPLRSRFSKLIVKFVFNHAALITVRDYQSVHLLTQIGVTKKIEVFSDPVFAIGYDQKSFFKNSETVVLSIRNWKKQNHQFLHEIAMFIDWLNSVQKLKVLFLPFQKFQSNDLDTYYYIKKLLNNSESLDLMNVDNFQEALDQIARAKYLVGMRLHSILFAILTKKPFLAISYSDKVKDFLNSIKFNNYLNLSEVTFEKLKDHFVEIKNQRQEISLKLEKIKLNHTYQFFKHEQLLKELFAS